MSDTTFTVEIEGLDELKRDVSAARSQLNPLIQFAMVQSVNAVKNSAQQMAPYKTGTLRRSIYTDVSNGGFSGSVIQDSSIAPYGIFLEMGTAAHEILPVNRKALFWNGAFHPVKRVMHPGFAARPFMEPAMKDNLDTIQQYFQEAIQKLIAAMIGK